MAGPDSCPVVSCWLSAGQERGRKAPRTQAFPGAPCLALAANHKENKATRRGRTLLVAPRELARARISSALRVVLVARPPPPPLRTARERLGWAGGGVLARERAQRDALTNEKK